MKLKRRDFLRTSAIFGAGAFTFSPVLEAFSQSAGPLKAAEGGQWLPTTCQGCTTWCPIEVFVQNGRAVKVRGNQNSKVNPGNCCPRGHLIPQQMYDPDRVKMPLKRTNPLKGKGIDPQFVPITWDEAIDTIAGKMMELRAANETHKFMVLRGRYTFLNDILYGAVPKIFGSPNGISHSSICAEAEKSGAYWTEAFWDYRDYDILNTKYLILWGVDPFRSNRQVPGMISRWPQIRENAKVVVIDPFFTTSASKADRWLAVKPGQDGALASAMAHHILVKGMWNREFVGDFNGTGASSFTPNTQIDESHFTEKETSGIIKWWNIELKDKTLEWAAALTGISASVIKDVAEEMASKAPKVSVWYGPGPVMSPRGTYTAMAIYALNGLVGSVDNVGGPIRKPSISTAALPDVVPYQDDMAKTNAKKPKIDQRGTLKHPAMNKTSGAGVVLNNVANAMLSANPYDIKVVIGYWCNFVFSCTEPKRWYDAMAKLPFFAHITTNASEMTQFADIVLPATHHATERLSFVQTNGNMHSELSIQQPIAKKLFDVKTDETEISFMLAEKLKAKGFLNLYDYFTKAFIDPETKATPTTPLQFEEIAARIITYPSYKTLAGGWSEFLQKGVITKGPYEVKKLWGGKFGTKTGKFEFYSETLKKALQDHATKHTTTVDVVLQETNYEARGELAFVPHYESPLRWGDKSEYPFDFVDVKSRYNREGRSANLPFYNQFKVLDPGDKNWEDCIKINPVDAAGIGIADGDDVAVISVVGELKTKARLWEGVRPGTAVKTYGNGHWAYGRFASDYAHLKETGGNNNEVLPDDYDRISGSTARNGGFTGVKIVKI